MKIFKNTMIGLVTGALLLIGSCTNLDEHLWNDIPESAIDPSDPAVVNAFMGKVLNAMGSFYWGYEHYWDIEETTDLYTVPRRLGVGWGGGYVTTHKHLWSVNIGPSTRTYDQCMIGIQYACKCLDLLPENMVKERARMRFFRAFYYYIILDLFRNPPFMETMEFEEGWMPSQIGAEALFNFIVSEIVAVKEDLGTQKNFGYPNRWVACMTLAKLYLNHNAWFRHYPEVTKDNSWYEKALAEVNDVINTGGYSLSPKYFDNVKAELKANPEIIFGIALDRVQDSYYGNYLVNKTHAVAGRDVYGYTGNSPWNGSHAVPQFIMSYDPADNRLRDSWIGGIARYYTVDGGINSGAPIPFTADDWSGTGYLNYNIEVHSSDNPGAYQQEGYRFSKLEVLPGLVGCYGNDVPFFRLGDAMFIKAECLLRLGRDKQEAADLITAVRMRLFDDPAMAVRTVEDLEGPSVYPYGYRECTSIGYDVWDDWIDIPEGGDDIILGGLLDDLAWEFLGEHHRRQDLIRFTMTNGISVFSGKSWFCKKAHPTEQWREYFGFSEGWLRANLNLVQNPGYLGI